MKKQIYIVCALCISNSYLLGMEQQQPCPATVTHEVARAQQQDIIKITSSHGGKEYELNKHAAALSQVLRTIVEIVEEDTNDPLEFDFADNQIAFIAAVLTYVSRTSVEGQTQEQLAEIIMGIGRQFGLSFVDMLHLANYFDIPLAFNALTSIQPLPLPSPIAAVEYNKVLAIVFDMAISTASVSRPSDDRVADVPLSQQRLNRVGSVQLWQLFGRMLYPDCMRYAEVQRMFDGIKARFDVETTKILLHQIMLGEYMQQHPELYSHPLQSLAGHRSSINSVVFSPDGKLIASGSGDIASGSGGGGAINLWVVGESSRILIQVSGSSVNTLAFSPDGILIASGLNNGHIDIWGIDGSLQRTFECSPYAVYSVAFSPDGTMLVSGNGNGEVVLWNMRTGLPIRKFENKDVNYPFYSVAFSPDGQSIAASNNIGIQLWSVVDGSQKGQLKSDEKNAYHVVFSVAYSLDGSMIVSGKGNEKVQLWRVADKKLLHTFDVHADMVPGFSYSSVAFNPDGRSIISGVNDHAIRVLSVADKKLVRRIEIGHGGLIYTVAASPNGTMIASGSRESSEFAGQCFVQLWGYRDLFEALRAHLFTPGFLEKAFPHTERRAVEAQETSDEDEPVVLPAPLPEKKK